VLNQKIKIIVLCGPTAVGKTALSLQIAETFSCEIISVDSMQVYRNMDIGTAKPTKTERDRVKHYLIDIVDPDETYTLGRFVKDADEAIQEITSHNNIPLLVGGTGLYLKGLLEGVFDESALGVDIHTGKDKATTGSVKDNLRKRLQQEGNEILYRELAEVEQNASIPTIPKDCFEDLKFFTLLAYHGPGIWQIKEKVLEIIMRLRLV